MTAVAPAPPPLTFRLKTGYGLGALPAGILLTGLGAAALNYYLNQVVGIPPYWTGTLVLVSLIIDAILDPMIGQWLDNVRTRWGRRHPFMYVGAALMGIAFYFLWHAPKDLPPQMLLAYMLTLLVAVRMAKAGGNVLATRASQTVYEAVLAIQPKAEYHAAARAITLTQAAANPGKGMIAVVCAGTSDLPVAEEAVVTARLMGNTVELVADVGVAGIHRLLAQQHTLKSARVLIVCAGMEGALPTVVGGLVNAPVIAVPTSVGYGASFGGIAALLGMLNTCSPNISVVNIDNGFGAASIASLINHM